MEKKMHTPGIMRVSTAIEISANAARRWRDQYKDWNDDDTFADGTTKGAVNKALNGCRHTPANIARVLNEGWARPQCNSCGAYHDVVVQIQEHFGEGYEQYCTGCLKHALNLSKATGQ